MLVNDLPADACDEAKDWLGGRRSAPKAWKDCDRGDWMLWLLARRDADRKQLVLAACACARLSLPYVPKGEDRPRKAIETAEAWARGGVTMEEVRTARRAAYAAYAAANAAYAAANAYAAHPDADATATAANAANAANAAANAAHYAANANANANANAAYYAAHVATLAKCADIVREHFPDAP